MRRRLTLLISVVTVVFVTAACGRATDDQINQVLGITPTATMSAEAIASATEAAEAAAAARLAAASTPGAALGDVTLGARQFQTWCAACHGPGGSGPDLLAAGGPGASVTADTLLPLVREAVGHPKPPGPFLPHEISDKQVADIAAYLDSEAGG